VLQNHLLELARVDRLLVHQPIHEHLHELLVIGQRLVAVVVRLLDQFLGLLVDQPLGRVRRRLGRAHLAAAVGRLPGDGRAERVAVAAVRLVREEAPLRDHAAREVADLLQVVGRARRDVLPSHGQLLGDAAAQSHRELALEELVAVQARLHAVLGRREKREAAGAVRAGNNGHLGDAVVARRERRHDRVARLVPRDELLALARRVLVLEALRRRLLHADLQAVDREVDLVEGDDLLLAARGDDGRLVHEVLEGRAGEADGPGGDRIQIDVRGERLVAAVDLEDLNPSSLVRQVDGDAAVEAARSQQGVVEDVGAVRRGDDDHARVAREAVHLRQDLVESLLALIIRREATARRALPPDGVDLVDEDDARRVLLRVSEQASDARRADADEHLDELGTGAGDERDTGLARNRSGKQCFAGPGRTLEHHASGRLGTHFIILLGVRQEVHDLLEFEFGRVAAGDVVERDARLGLHLDLALGLEHAHGPAGAAHAAHAAHAAAPSAEEEEAS